MAFRIKQFNSLTPLYHEEFVKKFTIYLKDVYVSASLGQTLYFSNDSTTWTSQTVAGMGNAQFTDMAWSPSLKTLVCVSQDISPSNTSYIVTTNDGISFTTTSMGAVDFRAVEWSPSLSLFVAVGLSGACYTSPNGTTWTSRTAASSNNWECITWSSSLNLFVALSTNGTWTTRCMTSSNGTSWTTQAPSIDAYWTDVIWVEDLSMYIAVASRTGTDATIMTSTNGTSWTTQTLPANGNTDWVGLSYSPSLSIIVAVAMNTNNPGGLVMSSTNGTSWTLHNVGPGTDFNRDWYAVAWSESVGKFVAVHNETFYSPTIMSSTNGTGWSLGASGAGAYGYSIIRIED